MSDEDIEIIEKTKAIKRPLLAQKCERCGCRSRFPMTGLVKLKASQRLTRTTEGHDYKLICVKCAKVLFEQELIEDPAIPTKINAYGNRVPLLYTNTGVRTRLYTNDEYVLHGEAVCLRLVEEEE